MFKLVWKEILGQTQLTEINSERVFLIFVHMQFQEIFCESFTFRKLVVLPPDLFCFKDKSLEKKTIEKVTSETTIQKYLSIQIRLEIIIK